MYICVFHKNGIICYMPVYNLPFFLLNKGLRTIYPLSMNLFQAYFLHPCGPPLCGCHTIIDCTKPQL